jgi:ferredoxin
MPLRSAAHLFRFYYGDAAVAEGENLPATRSLSAVVLGQAGAVADGVAQDGATGIASVVQRYVARLAHVHGAARAARVAEARTRCARLRALLAADDSHAPRARSAEALAGALGGLHAGLLDPQRLASSLGVDKGPLRLSAARRSRAEGALKALSAACDAQSGPSVYVFHRGRVSLPVLPDAEVIVDAEPFARASIHFDTMVAPWTSWARAERVARLELSHAYEEGFHDAVLDGLTLRELTLAELHALPAVLVLEDAAPLSSLPSALMLAPRPLQVLVHCVWDADAGRPAVPVATWASLAERSGLHVVSSSTSCGDHLDAALERMARATVPALALIAASVDDGLPTSALELAVRGRLHPLFEADPQRCERSERTSLAHNPAPAEPWARLDVKCVLPSGQPTVLSTAITPADLVETTPFCTQHLLPLVESEWAADQVPLAELASSAAGRTHSGELPYVWLLDGRDQLVRALVSRSVLEATCDVAVAYARLQEACGIHDPWVLAEVDAERKRGADALAESIEAERAKHALELASARDSAGADALRRLVDVLLDPDFLGASSATASPAPSTAQQPVHDDAPVTKVQERPPAPGPVSAAAQCPAPAEPYVESERCTSCNECTQKHPSLFAYDDNKQATYVGPAQPAFAALVSAAEKCPARCIHVGDAPRDPAISPELVRRAGLFT